MENENEEQKEYKKSVINRSQVKEVLGLSVSTEYLNKLEEKVLELIKDSRNRTLGNGRRTVLPRDI